MGKSVIVPRKGAVAISYLAKDTLVSMAAG